ncbi:MAG: SUMF1/EgtB/PvdO family nonheme iron enzyme [Pyrinomonadaceae bacterium]
MGKRFFTFGLFLAVWFSGLQPVLGQRGRELIQKGSEPQKRTALVIGNANYTTARKLVNSVNDATDMAAALDQLGFEVISGTDLNLREMIDKVREFGDKLRANGGVGLFYYAGHGVQVSGRNFLVPVDADIPREDEVAFYTLQLDLVLQKMATANNGLNIVILDACRNNPFARSWNRGADETGLAQVTAPTGTFIAYATSPGRTASDGTGRNGLYTSQLLKYIKQPGLKIEEAFKQVTIGVDRSSGGTQIPWTSSSLRGEFYFTEPRAEVAVADRKKEPEKINRIKSKTEEEGEAWEQVKNSDKELLLRLFLENFPDGPNSGRAKLRLEELVWQSAKESNDKARLEAYLKEFPNGANAPAAQVKLRQLALAEKNIISLPKDSGANVEPKANEKIRKTILRGNVEMSFVYVPAGDFEMGSDNGDADEKPVHKVKISRGFWMQTTEVTQAQWQAVMGTTLRQQRDKAGSGLPLYGEGPDFPMYYVSWDDARQFISKLNAQNDGYTYRLPTEAEWEYAARAGTDGDYAGQLDSLAWYQKNSGNRTHEVGTKSSNGWGLSDMHGNVSEWVEDGYDPEYYKRSPETDPKTAASGSSRVNRGGSWDIVGGLLRSANRYYDKPAVRFFNLGFRVIRN